MKEVKKLSEISDITTGLVVKRKQAANDFENSVTYKMLTLKSFNSEGYLDVSELDEFKSYKGLNERYLTQIGDVIVRLSSPHTSIVINEQDVGYVIPSLFVIVRVKGNAVLSEYLSIYLNGSKVKGHYARQSIGSAIQIIKTSMLKDLKINIPVMDEQIKIIEMNKLITKEKILLKELQIEKEKYHKGIINHLLKGESE